VCDRMEITSKPIPAFPTGMTAADDGKSEEEKGEWGKRGMRS